MYKKILSLIVAGICICASVVGASSEPTLVRADDIVHDNALGMVVATGNVEISNGQDVLRADKVIYNQKLQTVTAIGNVTLYYKTGDILSAEYLELTEDFKQGFIDKIYLLTVDNSRIAGRDAHKDGSTTVMNHGVYSPCALCVADPEAPPTWQLKAAHIERDEEAGDIYYSHMRMEFLGTTVFYLPFLSHADPSVERRSGILPFSMGYDSRYGFMTGIPYYFAISQDQDYTVVPILTTEGGIFLDNEYRKRFSNGNIKINGGVGYTDNQDWQKEGRRNYEKRYWGHLFTKGEFRLTESWRFKFDINKVDSQTYLKRYPFLDTRQYGTKNMLDSTAEFEGFFGNDYGLIKGHWFQDLRPSVQRKQTPLVFPYLYYQHMTNADSLGGYWTVDMSETMVVRQEGSLLQKIKKAERLAKAKQVNRLYGSVAYNIPYFTSDGSVFNIQGLLRSSLYSIRGYQVNKNGPAYTGTYGRAFPQLTVSWRKPYVQSALGGRFILEPQVSMIYGARVSDERIPNEDSQGFEFAQSNLFSSNRLPGLDRIDDGQRLNYGINMYFFDKGQASTKFFIGQSYSFTPFTALPNARQKGVYKGFSDFITHATFTPGPNFKIEGGFMLDRNKLTPKRSQISMTLGSAAFQVNTTYTFAKEIFADEDAGLRRHQLALGLQLKHEEYTLNASLLYDFGHRPGALSYSTMLGYQNDCFGLSLSYVKTYLKDRTVKPSDSYFLTFHFKNLGTYETGALGAPTSYKRHGQLF